jgi:hypothetical protein
LYDDLLIEFSGEKSEPAKGDQSAKAADADRVSTKVHSTARYAFDGKRYRLISGTNVAPEI